MATVIDALLITLGFDASQFKSGTASASASLNQTKQNANTAAKQIEASGKQAAQFFTKMRNEALGLLAVFLGGKGIGAFVSDTVTSLSALSRAAHNIDMPVEDLAAFRNMIERSGGSAASAEGALRGLSDAMQRLNTMGDKSILPGLQAIGGSATDKPMELIRKFTAFASDPHISAARVNQVGAMLNIPQDVIDRLNKGVAGLDAGMKRSKELDRMTPGMAERAKALQEAWGSFREAADGLAKNLLDRLAPALTVILNAVAEGVIAVAKFTEQYPDLTKWVLLVAGAFLSLNVALRAFALLRMVMGGAGLITSLFGGGVGAIGAITSGVGALTTALSALLLPLAAVAAWYTALHISSGAGAEELAKEKAHTEEQARTDPDNVIPRVAPDKHNPAREFYQRNAPRFMGGGVDPSSGGGTDGARGGKNMADPAQLMAYFKSQGWTEEQATGILANFKGESNFDAAAVGDKGASAGLGQWRGARRDAFKSMYGHDVQFGTPMEQAQFTQWELTHTEKKAGDALRATTNKADAARVVSRKFERPGQTEDDKTMNAEHRAQFALDPNLVARPGPRGGSMQTAQNDNSSETHIGAITINTQATDAKGIAAGIGPAIRRQGLVAQATTGLS